jgi:hypothetical protein
MSPEKFAQQVVEVVDKSKKVDWSKVSDTQYAQFIAASQVVGADLSIMNSLDAVKRAFFRHALVLTVGVLGALLLKVDGTKIAFATCVLTALHSVWISVVLWGFTRTAVQTLESFKSFVDARASRGEKEE